MKKHKRNKADTAYSRGYLAGVQGRSRDHCPYIEGPSHEHWINGWVEGRDDLWRGYSGIAGLHRSAHLSQAV